MQRKSFIAILIVLLVAAGLLVRQASLPGASAGTVQPNAATLALLPAQATLLFGLDLDALRTSATYAAWRQRADRVLRLREYSEFAARTGLDLERDLAAVTGAAWRQPLTPERNEPVFLAVVTARYQRSNLSSFLREKGSPSENYRGFELFNTPGARHNPAALALVDDQTILAGTASAVRQALDLKIQAGHSVLENQALMERVRTIGADNQLWAVSLAPGALLKPPATAGGPGQPNVVRLLERLEATTFALNASYGLRMLAEGTCASEQDARTLADAARGLLAMLRLSAPADRPEALELLSSFEIEQQARLVRVTADIPQPLLDQLAENPAQLFSRPPRRPRPSEQEK